jgi:nitrite reductase/ring-hydroxylating ferredoxin subunit
MQRLSRLRLFVGVGSLLQLCVFFLSCQHADSFTLVMMGARRGKGDLGRSLDPNSKQSMGASKNKGQEITGVTLPAVNGIRGWEFGEGVQMVCANVGGKYLAIQGNCPRCAFDLWRGDLIVDDPGFKAKDLPIIACPTCATTYSMATGKHGPPLKRTGLQAFTTGLAKSATNTDAYKDAKAFRITRDEDSGQVFCKER